jgi:hypothetical protein
MVVLIWLANGLYIMRHYLVHYYVHVHCVGENATNTPVLQSTPLAAATLLNMSGGRHNQECDDQAGNMHVHAHLVLAHVNFHGAAHHVFHVAMQRNDNICT